MKLWAKIFATLIGCLIIVLPRLPFERASVNAATEPPFAGADEIVGYNSANNGDLLYGPLTVFIGGINPLRYPNWQATIDSTVIAPPASVFGTLGGVLPSPIPLITSSPEAQVSDDALLSEPGIDADKVSKGNDACSKSLKLVGDFDACFKQARTKYQTIITQVGTPYEQSLLDNGTANKGGDQILLINSALQHWKLLYVQGDDVEAKLLQRKEHNVDTFYAEVQTNILGSVVPLRSQIEALKDWPTDLITSAKQDFAVLAAVQATSTPPCKTSATDEPCKTDLREVQRINTAIPDLDPSGSRATKFISLRTKLLLIDQQRLVGLTLERFGFVKDVSCQALFSGGRERLLTVSPTPDRHMTLKVSCVSRVFSSYGIAFSDAGTHNYVAAAPPVTPPAKAVGTPVPANSSQAVVVTDNGSSKYQPTLVTMEHFALYQPRTSNTINPFDGVGAYATVGIGATTSTNSTNSLNFNFLYGLSFAAYRSLVVTFGQQYATETSLSSGYSVGQTILAIPGAPIPTTSTYKFRPFLSLTLGKQ